MLRLLSLLSTLNTLRQLCCGDDEPAEHDKHAEPA